MTIKINNLDLKDVHIDTHSTLTGESFCDYELETLAETNENVTYDDFKWEYDHRAIVTDFAKKSINIVLQAIAHENGADCIKGITYVSSHSPKFYNYISDSYVMAVECDTVALHDYIAKNYTEIYALASRYNQAICDGSPDSDSLAHAAVCHIINNAVVADDYNMSMWEVEHEVYSENTTITKIEKETTTA